MDLLRRSRIPTFACLCVIALAGCGGKTNPPTPATTIEQSTASPPPAATRSASPAVPSGTVGAGTFDRAIPSIGLNAAVWNGGTLAQVIAAVPAAGGITATVFSGGPPVVLVPNAPEYVNAAFSKAHPDGVVPPGTIMIVAKR